MKTTIEIIQPEHGKITTADIVRRLNEKFTTLEQFNQRLDIHCLDIAAEMGAIYTCKPAVDTNEITHCDGWIRVFDFTQNV